MLAAIFRCAIDTPLVPSEQRDAQSSVHPVEMANREIDFSVLEIHDCARRIAALGSPGMGREPPTQPGSEPLGGNAGRHGDPHLVRNACASCCRRLADDGERRADPLVILPGAPRRDESAYLTLEERDTEPRFQLSQ